MVRQELNKLLTPSKFRTIKANIRAQINVFDEDFNVFDEDFNIFDKDFCINFFVHETVRLMRISTQCVLPSG